MDITELALFKKYGGGGTRAIITYNGETFTANVTFADAYAAARKGELSCVAVFTSDDYIETQSITDIFAGEVSGTERITLHFLSLDGESVEELVLVWDATGILIGNGGST